MLKAVSSGRCDEIVDLTKVNPFCQVGLTSHRRRLGCIISRFASKPLQGKRKVHQSSAAAAATTVTTTTVTATKPTAGATKATAAPNHMMAPKVFTVPSAPNKKRSSVTIQVVAVIAAAAISIRTGILAPLEYEGCRDCEPCD